MSRAVSSRWSPTTEQLMILEELYRSGIRTPSASQIKHITTHLSFYGRIEGKNVFYWFQNHKARDRLKLRRKINKQRQLQQQILQVHHCPPNEDISHYFVGSFDYPLGSSTQQLSFYNSAGLFFQGGAADTSGHAINCKWSVHNPQSLVEQTEMTFYNYEYDWTLVDVNQASSCCIRPLKTLDLFPVTATKLKDCNTWPKHLYHFMPNN